MVGSGFLNFKILEALLCCITADFKTVLSNSAVPDSSVNPWAVAHQAPLFIGYSRQENWSDFPFPVPGHLLNPGIWTHISASPVLASGFFTSEPPGEPDFNEVSVSAELLYCFLIGMLFKQIFWELQNISKYALGSYHEKWKRKNIVLRNVTKYWNKSLNKIGQSLKTRTIMQ